MSASFITQTLRSKLFDAPHPTTHQTFFAEFQSQMFPGRGYFLRFLESKRSETQIDTARSVLLRLAYEAEIFQPNKLLFNLIQTESTLANETSGKPDVFHGRDHFAHLVHLYLLGLYIFWYHRDLHVKVCRQFKRLLTATGQTSKGTRSDVDRLAISTFISCWRDFVLFHDLGYPWEANSSLKEKATEYLKPFGNLVRYTAKDCALYALSQLIALQWIRKQKEKQTLEEDLPAKAVDHLKKAGRFELDDLFHPESPISNNSEILLQAEQLPLANDLDLLRLVRLFVEPSAFISIMVDQKDEFVASSQKEVHRAIEIASGDSESDHQPQIIARMAESGKFPVGHTCVHYVINLDKHLENFLEMIYPEKDGVKEFMQLADMFSDELSSGKVEDHEDRFSEYGFIVFKHLLTMLDFDELDSIAGSSLLRETYVIDESLKNLGKGFLEESMQFIKLNIQREIDTLKDQERTLATEPLDAYLLKILEPLKNINALADKLKSNLSSRLRKRIALKKSLLKQYSDLKNKISKSLQTKTTAQEDFITNLKEIESKLSEIDKCTAKSGKKKRLSSETGGSNEERTYLENQRQDILKALGVFAPVNIPEKIHTQPSWTALNEHPLISPINDLLIQRGLDGMDALKDYRPGFAPKPSSRHPPSSITHEAFDHGLASGLLYLEMHKLCSKLASEEATGSCLFRLLTLRGRNKNHSPIDTADVQSLQAEVAYSIFIHNLYPQSFDKDVHKKFRTTNQTPQAFTFLALLCDSLQTWDRKRLFNQGTGDLPYSIHSEDFNIEVHQKIIRITERGRGPALNARQWGLRDHLNHFLSGASAMIELNLSEFLPIPDAT